MSCDEFEMDAHFSRLHCCPMWDIKARDGDTKMMFTVYDDAVQETVRDNFDDLADTIKKEILDRLDNRWKLNKIGDSTRAVFIEILEAIL